MALIFAWNRQNLVFSFIIRAEGAKIFGIFNILGSFSLKLQNIFPKQTSPGALFAGAPKHVLVFAYW